MRIQLIKKPAVHGWAVLLDGLEVNFHSQEEAARFIGQLKARIDAPHVWPNLADKKSGADSSPGNRSTPGNDLHGARSNSCGHATARRGQGASG